MRAKAAVEARRRSPSPRSSASASAATRRRPSPPRPCSRRPPQAGLRRAAHDAHRAAALRGRRHRRRDGRPDHLHAHRRRADGARGDRRDPRACRRRSTAATTCRRRRANTPAKAKNAQEAHEAIRPTDVARTPESVARYLDADQRRLYELIWKRAVACQMASAVLDQVDGRDRRSGQAHAGCAPPARSSPSTASSSSTARTATTRRRSEDGGAGCCRRWRERDPLDARRRRPPTSISPSRRRATPRRAWSRRWRSSASAGPPPTPRSCQVLQDRNYVRLEKRRFIPEDRGRLVTAFLTSFFERYVDTASPPSWRRQLDDISGGRVDWRAVLRGVLGGVLARRRADQGPEDQPT